MKLTLTVAVVVALLDQLTKALIAAHLAPGETIVVTPFLQLVTLYNPGAAFSLLAQASGWQRPLLLLLAVAVSLWLLWQARQTANRRAQIAFGLILGGALGNAWDRLVHGAVHDFLLLHYRQWAWPAFNLADSAITAGVLLLFWYLKGHSDDRSHP
jgi:signal peptidase II